MADTLKSLIDEQVQQQVDNLVASLRVMLDLIRQANSSGFTVKGDGTGIASQRQATESLAASNEKLNQSQKNLIVTTQQAAQAHTMQAQTMQASSTRMAALTQNSALLKQALDDVKKQLQDGIAAGKLSSDQQAKLAQQTQVLTTLVNQQQKGFGSLTMELRAGERALQSMREAGLQNTPTFKTLQLSVADTRREFKHFADEQNLLSKEAPAVAAMTAAARGLGGAYATGAGAAALFGGENEKVEKELNKLVAVMTLLQGINEANEAFQKRGAITTAITVTWNKVLTAVYGEEAVAAATAAEATGALYAVMTGGIILVIGALVAGIVALTKGSGEAAKAQLELSEQMAKTNEVVEKQVDLIGERWKNAIDRMKEEIAVAQAAGESQVVLFAKRKLLNDLLKKEHEEKLALKIAEAEKEYAGSGIKGTDALIASRNAHMKKNEEYTAQSLKLSNELIKYGEFESSSYKEKIRKQIEDLDKLAANEKKHADSIIKIDEDAAKIKADDEALSTEKSKLNTDQLREYKLTSAKYEQEDLIRINEEIFSNEESTHQQRIKAAKDMLAEKLAIIKAEENAKKSDPANATDPNKIKQIELDAGEARRAAKFESNHRIEQENKRAAMIELKAYYDLKNSVLETQKEMDEEILQSEASTLMERLKARQNEISSEIGLEDNRYALAKSKKGLTDSELQALEAEHQVKVNSIVDKGNRDIKKIQDDAYKAQLDAAKKQHDSLIKAQTDSNTQNKSALLSDEAMAYEKLNQQYLNGEISLKKYTEAKEKLDAKFAVAKIDEEIAGLEKLQKVEGTTYLEKKKIDDQIALLEKQRSDAQVKDAEYVANKKKEKIDEVLKWEQKGSQLITSIVDGAFDRRKNQIQHEMDLISQRQEADVNAVNTSTLNQQQKAAQLIVIEQTAAANKQKLAREQRQEDIKKAKFDKEVAMLQIVINTAAAVMKAAPNVPEMIAMGVMGAIELGIVAAKPIPQFAKGTDFAPGGLAVVGEKGHELQITPSGEISLTPDKPTLTNLERGTKIIPNEEMNNYLIKKSLVVNDLRENSSDSGTDLQVIFALNKVERAIKNQKQPIVNVWNDSEFNAHIDKMVRN